MARLAAEQYVPIFVGSTFVDLKSYRDAVCRALNRLEMVVRGMEYFGSKPGSPVDECLTIVRSCRLYIGIFGMRYGSIPDGNDRSMTHLEYEEAQRNNLPSLVYILDEERQPILPIHVETGDGAAKLRILKTELRKKHVVSLFTTEDDLAARILADVPPALREIGTYVQGELPLATPEMSTRDQLRRFSSLPKRFAGTELTLKIRLEYPFHAANGSVVGALKLAVGDTVVSSYARVLDDAMYDVFAEGPLAEQVLSLEKGSKISARVVTVFGVRREVEFSEEGAFSVPHAEVALLLKEILSVEPAAIDAG